MFIIQNVMETLTEKNDQQSSVAELQEKIGILLAVVFYVNSFVFFFFVFLNLEFFFLCIVVLYFLYTKEDGEVDTNANSYRISLVEHSK